jgi:CRISPR-associated protein Cmr5
VPDEERKDYDIAVSDLGADILRSALYAALADVQRLGGRGKLPFAYLAAANVASLDGATAADLAKRVRTMEVDAYMIAAREMLEAVKWLTRVVQAKLE